MNAILKINGKRRIGSPKKGDLSVNYDEALKLILSVEAETKFPEFIQGELPAIISHWLQALDEDPILLDASFGKKWTSILRRHCQLKSHNPASGKIKETKNEKDVFIDFSALPFPPNLKAPQFTFIDLFAGIGGFRLGLESRGGRCVFTSEWDKHAKETYYKNYGEIPFGDITRFTDETNFSENSLEIPNHDILCGGFPCQPFSQAGLQRGFDDARGTLFFDILKIAREKKPKVLFLENVKRLKGHDKGKTFAIICNSLRELGYKVYAKVLRAYDYGVPQNRERIFIVAFSEPIKFSFPERSRYSIYQNVGDVLEESPSQEFTISDRMWDGHQRRKLGHRERGNGFGYSLFTEEDEYVNTISARYWKDGSEILIKQPGENPRVITPREAARIQGYPEEFQFHDTKRHAWQQFGNSVAVPVISAITEEIVKSLANRKQASDLVDILAPEIL